MPNTGRLTRFSVVKENAWGTYLTPTKALSIVSDNLLNKVEHTEDPRLIGQLFTTDMIKTGEIVEGPIDLTVHPEELGFMMAMTLGKNDAPTTSPKAIIYLAYSGADAYASITITSGVWVGKSGATQGTATQKFSFDTSNALYDTIAELVAAITAISGFYAYGFGLTSASPATIADVTETALLSAGNADGYLAYLDSASSTTKIHHIYPLSATDTQPSLSAVADLTLGAGQCLSYAGLKINTTKIDIKAGEIIKQNFGLIGKVEATGVTYPSVSPLQDKPYIAGKARVFLNGIEATNILDVSLDVNNNMDKPKYVGSLYIGEQIGQGGSITLNGTLNLDYTTWASKYINYFKADVPMEILIYMENAGYADQTNNVLYCAMLKINNLKLTSWDSPITGPNRITTKFAGTATFESGKNHLDAYVVDTNTSAY